MPGLAEYNQEAYDFCPLTDPNRSKHFPVKLKREMDADARQIYNTIRDQFDKILYFLENGTGLYFNEKLSKDLLRNYWGRDGWLYRGARTDNMPWIFAYMTLQQTLYGRWIVKGSQLHKDLTKSDDIGLVDTSNPKYVQVKTKTAHVRIFFYFTNHHAAVDSNNDVTESIDFVVFGDRGDRDGTFRLSTLKIQMDTDYFLNTLHKPCWNTKHVEWAKVLPALE